MALEKGDPTNPDKCIIVEFRLTKYSWWESSGWLVCDLRRLELTNIAEQFGLICRQAYRKVSKPASKQISM